jgi:8-oxo-dGTP pyrophosphatase MutT (NUDIX family)
LELPTWQGWVLPGGGIEDGEDELAAIRRELAEEVGLVGADLVGPIWERTVRFRDPVIADGQTDRIWFVRCAPFDPTPVLPWDVLRAEGMTDLRWWTRDGIAASAETFAPVAWPPCSTTSSSTGPRPRSSTSESERADRSEVRTGPCARLSGAGA